MGEREYSRCEKCGKRLAFLGPAQPRPCPSDADDPVHCAEVMNALVLARQIRIDGGVTTPYHAETLDLLSRTGFPWEAVDAEIARRSKVDADERFLRYDTTMLDPVSDWISGDRDRAVIIARWAIGQINVCDGSTMREIYRMQDGVRAEIIETIDGMTDDLEMDVEPAGP